ncbi:MarR family winged helix-turn-helix transcriptional regulator [Sediminibacillus massiliensis]|uniref:MarR family winged helix-turn-helix transcriptional regulator n=1 Tax=Sediminibacillus massiliensis TaxID=1926277 RepID=UPI000988897B|nr:MarR family transcriptional regulator [Sediminibacillus massiliensis]
MIIEHDRNSSLISGWLSLTDAYGRISNELEARLQQEHDLSLKEFYVLLFLHESPDKKLRLQQLQSMVGLSQSAMSRLVSRFEAKGCGALQREICQDDRRNIYTSITGIGESKLEKATITFHQQLESALDREDVKESLARLFLAETKHTSQ